MIRWYKLVGKVAVLCDDMLEWAQWRQTHSNIVAQEQIGPLFVSTVFLGLDHRHFGPGDPLLFETMIFDDGDDGYQERTSTWGEAEKAHAAAVAVARQRVTSADRALSPATDAGRRDAGEEDR